MRKRRDDVAMIRVRVFGSAEFEIGHRRVGMNTEVLFALGLYLTTRAGEPIPRDELLELLWGKAADGERRHALRQLLYRLRQKGLVLDEDGDRVRLDAVLVDSDLRAALDAAWIEKASTEEIDAAGEPLPSFSRRMSPNFLAWLDEVRERAHAHHRKAALRQIAVARREGRWADLDRWARPVLRSDPLNEEATLARAESAAMAGSKTMAIEILDTYLSEVCEISPDLGKPALALRKRLSERRADWAMRGPKEVPLVGRTELMSRLTGLVDAAWRGEGGAVMLVGAPGIGKTRLAMEARAYAEMRGMRTVVVRAEAGMGERPLSVVVALAPILVQMPGAAGSSPLSIDLLRRQIARSQGASPEVTTGHDSLRDDIVAAVEDVLVAVSGESRLCIVVEDCHFIDAESTDVLVRLSKRTRGRRIAWIATSRPIGVDAVHGRLRFEFPTSAVSPLNHDETSRLVQATLASHKYSLSPQSISDLARLSGGNPLFAREIGNHRALNPEGTSMPGSLRDILADRAGRLDAVATRVLRVVSLLHGSASIHRVQTVSGLQPREFSETIEQLEIEGILTAAEGQLVLHDLWRQHVDSALRGAVRSALAHECAVAMSAASEGLSIQDSWRTAELFRTSGNIPTAHQFLLQATDGMLRMGLPTEAARLLEDSAWPLDGPEVRIAAIRRRAEAHHSSGDLSAVIDATSGVLDLAALASSGEALSDAALAIAHRADALAKSHLSLDRELDWLRLASRDRRIPSRARAFAAYTGIRRALFRENRMLAREIASSVQTCSEGASESLAAALVTLIFAAEFGVPEDVLRADENLQLLRCDNEPLSLRCSALRFRAHALRMAGYYDRAALLGEQAFEISLQYHQKETALNAAEMMTFLFLDSENLTEAYSWLARWRELSQGVSQPMRDKGLVHASKRARLQGHHTSDLAADVAQDLESVRRDSVSSRRAGELATAAWAAAVSGHQSLVLELVSEALSAVEGREPEFLLDYPHEALARALSLIDEKLKAERLSREYMEKRRQQFDRPLPKFYRFLRFED